MWRTRHSAEVMWIARQCGRNRPTLLNVGRRWGGGAAIPSRVLDRWTAPGRFGAGPLRRRRSGKGRAVPALSVDSRFAALNPFYGDRSRMRWGGDWRDPPQARVREMG